MKKILFLFAFLISFGVSAQQDTVKLYNKTGAQIGYFLTDKVAPIHDTLNISVSVPCDTIKPQPQTPFLYTLYVGSEFAAIFNDATKGPAAGLALKNYLRDYGYNGVSYYGLSSISSSKWPQLRAFNYDLRKNYGIVYIEATASSSATFAGDRANFNKGCSNDLEKFNGFNMEREFWNAKDAAGNITTASVLAAWQLDSVEWKKSNDAAIAAGVSFQWYLGWPLKNYAPVHQVKNSSVMWYHIYKSFPDTTYGADRWINANAAQKIINASEKKPVTVGVSGEAAFMAVWFKTHKIQELRSIIEPAINRNSNLKLVNIQVFMYSEMVKVQPPKTPAAATLAPASMVRISNTINIQGATPSHVETAVER